MTGAKEVATPMASSPGLFLGDGSPIDTTMYWRAVG